MATWATAVAVAVACTAPAVALPARFVMPWLCLERCGDNATAIAAQLNQFSVNHTVLNAASFELFNLGPNSTLIVNNLTAVAPQLAADGAQTWAMVSSYPYPPQFLTWMRQVFANPQPFIQACLAAAAAHRLTGFNIDWEPTGGNGAPTPTPQDALDYAAFLTTFSDAMHAHGVLTSVDVATWSEIWNLTALAATSVDFMATMQTYTDDWPVWQTVFQAAVATIPASKLVVGLETVRSDGSPYPTDELAQRFNAITAAGIHRVGIWRAGIPDNWWPFLLAV